MSASTAPRDNGAFRFPVSVKGVVIRDGAVVLVLNARDEWELPGGKLELGESPEQCVVRELEEELQLAVAPVALVDAWVYSITDDTHVLVLTYGCIETTRREAVVSEEHSLLRWVPLAELPALRLPAGYAESIRAWAARADASR